MRKIGDKLILEPENRKPLLYVLAILSPLTRDDEYPDIDETLLPVDDYPLDSKH